MIPSKQIALVHVARQRLALDEDDYRAMLKKAGGVGSAKELDAAGFHRLMEEFARLGFKSTARKRQYGPRAGMASPAQLRKIWRFWSEWSGAEDESALNRWLERSFHISAARFLTAEMGSKAIQGLRAMLERPDTRNSAGRRNGPRTRKKG